MQNQSLIICSLPVKGNSWYYGCTYYNATNITLQTKFAGKTYLR